MSCGIHDNELRIKESAEALASAAGMSFKEAEYSVRMTLQLMRVPCQEPISIQMMRFRFNMLRNAYREELKNVMTKK